MLSALRFPVAESRGRKYPELDHPYRNPFQRDRDRIVHARAFRRLEAKTQVFTPGLSDHFRNRLTHTIEVSQIARTVASVLDLDENLTEALALGHDIGHPPFAHAGEDELEMQFPGASHRERFQESLRRLIDLLVTGLIEGTAQTAAQSGARDVEEVRRHPGRLAAFTPESLAANRGIKRFLHSAVYASE